jgi:Hint domain
MHNVGNGATDVTLCFCAGTHIGTPTGEVPVERLQIGDPVGVALRQGQCCSTPTTTG